MFTCSFYACRSRKRKKLLELTVFFKLLGSAGVKAGGKHVDEIDPWFLVRLGLLFCHRFLHLILEDPAFVLIFILDFDNALVNLLNILCP